MRHLCPESATSTDSNIRFRYSRTDTNHVCFSVSWRYTQQLWNAPKDDRRPSSSSGIKCAHFNTHTNIPDVCVCSLPKKKTRCLEKIRCWEFIPHWYSSIVSIISAVVWFLPNFYGHCVDQTKKKMPRCKFGSHYRNTTEKFDMLQMTNAPIALYAFIKVSIIAIVSFLWKYDVRYTDFLFCDFFLFLPYMIRVSSKGFHNETFLNKFSGH